MQQYNTKQFEHASKIANMCDSEDHLNMKTTI